VIRPGTITRDREMASMSGKRNAYTVLVGQPEGRRSLGRPRYRRKDNSKTDCKNLNLQA